MTDPYATYATAKVIFAECVQSAILTRTITNPDKTGKNTTTHALNAAGERRIRRAYQGGIGIEALADRYGVNPRTIYLVVRWKTWANSTLLTPPAAGKEG